MKNVYKKIPPVFVVLILISTALACKAVDGSKTGRSSNVTAVPNTPGALSLSEVPTEKAKALFSDAESQQIFQGISSLTASGLRNIHVIGKFGTDTQDLHSGTYFVMKPQQAFLGYMLFVNALKYPHSLGITASIDYQPVVVEYNGTSERLPTFGMENNTTKAFSFVVPPLPPGLHTLTISLIMEPDHYFAFDPTNFNKQEDEAILFRDSPMELGVLLWVTETDPQDVMDWPEAARSIPPQSTSSIQSIVALREKAEVNKPALVLQNKDTFSAGETATYYLNFVAPVLGKGNFEIILVTTWDNEYIQTQRLSLDSAKITSDRFFPFKFQVPDDLQAGEHVLTMIAYPYPYYLRWWKDGQEWYPNASYFSYVAARLPVQINERR